MTSGFPSVTSFVPPKQVIYRHMLLCICFVPISLLLSQPEVILMARPGSVVWHPATALSLALMLAVSPWYVFLACFSDTLAGTLFYHQHLKSFSVLLGTVAASGCYGASTYLLRGPLRIDLGLRRQRDVLRYLFVTAGAGLGAASVGSAGLALGNSIPWTNYWSAALTWFSGDGIGCIGIAPFLLIYVFPWVRRGLFRRKYEVRTPEREQLPPKPLRAANWLEGAGQACATLLAPFVIFAPKWTPLQLDYLSLIPIIWIAVRHGIKRVVTGLLVLTFGMVVAMNLFPPAPALTTRITFVMLVVSTIGLILGAVVTERLRMGHQLQARTSYLNSLVANSPIGIMVLDQRGNVELTNTAFQKLFLYDPSGGHVDAAFTEAPGGRVRIRTGPRRTTIPRDGAAPAQRRQGPRPRSARGSLDGERSAARGPRHLYRHYRANQGLRGPASIRTVVTRHGDRIIYRQGSRRNHQPHQK